MSNDRPSDQRPSWSRGRSRLRFAARRNSAARPWYADRLERRQTQDDAAPLGPYETRYDVSHGYDRGDESR
jgi:hypothetical protein